MCNWWRLDPEQKDRLKAATHAALDGIVDRAGNTLDVVKTLTDFVFDFVNGESNDAGS